MKMHDISMSFFKRLVDFDKKIKNISKIRTIFTNMNIKIQ